MGKHIAMFYPPTQPNGMRTVDVASAIYTKLESGQEIRMEFNLLAADGTTFICAVQAKVRGVWGVRAMGHTGRMVWVCTIPIVPLHFDTWKRGMQERMVQNEV